MDGKRLEDFVQAMLEKHGIRVSRTSKKAGPGKPYDADMRTELMQIECKERDQLRPVTSCNYSWWDKTAKRSAQIGKFPVVVTCGQDLKEAIVHIRFRDFIQMVDET